jgi:hypothetical protein
LCYNIEKCIRSDVTASQKASLIIFSGKLASKIYSGIENLNCNVPGNFTFDWVEVEEEK